MKHAIIGQSGGPTAVINASLLGVLRGALSAGTERVYGMVNGIQGLLADRLIRLDTLIAETQYGLLRTTPGAFLGSCRYKLPEADKAVYGQILDILKRHNIGQFFYIGGNDSMDTVWKLSRYAAQTGSPIQFIGIPKTVDNDLAGTDHTPGYGSAAKYVAATVREIATDARVYDQDTVSIIEIMGRNAGWLTAASALACEGGDGPDLIYLPERPFSTAQFLADVQKVHETKRNVVVTVSEGVRLADGSYLCESLATGGTDIFGHKYLNGTARVMEQAVRSELGCKVRSMELNIPQRCAAHMLSATDLSEAEAVGFAGAEAAARGETGIMMTFARMADEPYHCTIQSAAIDGIANAERTIPPAWINAAGNGITPAFLAYARPLIQGEVTVPYDGGLPQYLRLCDLR